MGDVPINRAVGARDERDKVAALDAGADDYVGTAVQRGELLAAFRVALRHTSARIPRDRRRDLQVGELQVDLVRRRVVLGGRRVRLTPIRVSKLPHTLVPLRGKGRHPPATAA